ncbi:MAG: cytidine deaminase [Planctomycetaceae bacterium]|nr:cytidine deaminase [Planctomycetales bacterium]MCB9939789.1 cytidine deaminase [Planctomycetaceae bacterium]
MRDLTEEQNQKLIDAAVAARQQAYAPYSKFSVGAAVLAENGQIFIGCNVENASYGLTNCAERTAIFAAVAAGQTRFLAMAVATEGGYSPCGACRQVLAEFCDDLPILIVDTRSDRQVEQVSLAELLPRRFRRD